MDIRAVIDETEIRNLAYRFADAVNRGSVADFAALWTDDGRWVIDPPMGVSAQGALELSALFGRLMQDWTFFHQVPHQGPIELAGDSASARIYMHEIGIFKNGSTHRNWSEYTDTYRRVDGRWRYASRHYHFLYVDGPEMHPDLLGVAVER